MKTRIMFVEDRNIIEEATAFLDMLRARKVRRRIVLDTEVRMIEFRLSDYYYEPMRDFFAKRYPNKIAFTTIRR